MRRGLGTSSFLTPDLDSEGGGRTDVSPAVRLRDVGIFVAALSRAVQAFHTYPPESPARRDIVETVREALRTASRGNELVALNVTNEGLKYGGELVATDSSAERSLALALRSNYVATLEVDGNATTRDIRQFCALLAFPERLLNRVEELPEILDERGVTGIRTLVISVHQTIEGGSVSPDVLALVQRGQTNLDPSKEQAEGGWIRIDASVPLDRVALEDLPLVLGDASSLAVALQQMSGRRRETISRTDALVTHYDEITELYAAAAPEVSDTLFQSLADFVQELPAELKQELLRTEVLPGLIDGSRNGRILQHFVDEEVSSALWLLLDLGVGGIEMVAAGIANLNLPESRLSTIVDRVTHRLEADDSGLVVGDGLSTTALDQAAHLLRTAEGDNREFLAFRAFDLSLDDASTVELAGLVKAIEETDSVSVQLRCHVDVLSLSADSSVVSSVLRKARGLFLELEHRGRIAPLAEWMALFAHVSREREGTDAEIATLVRESLAEYLTPEFIHRVSGIESAASQDLPLVTIICGLKSTGVEALINSLGVESDRSARNRLLTSLAPRAGELAEYLADHLSHAEWYVVRNVLMLMGHGGAGHEEAIAECLGHEDSRVVREAFLALARIGSRAGAEHTVAALKRGPAALRRQGAEALWCYPPEISNPLVLAALGDRKVLRDSPDLVRMLADGASRRDLDGLEETFRRLRWNTLMIWNPNRRALGWCALQHLRRAT